MENELLCQVALTLIPNIGDVNAKALINHFGSASAIFSASRKELESIEGLGFIRVNSIKNFKDFSIAEDEIKFIQKYQINPLFITDEKYPKRLLNCYDSPPLLYYKGNADLNTSKIIAIVGFGKRRRDEAQLRKGHANAYTGTRAKAQARTRSRGQPGAAHPQRRC